MSSLPTEQEVFQCLCKDYGSSAAFSEIATRTDLFPNGSASVETWLRETTNGSILVTEDKKGKITVVNAFSVHARLCLDYSYNGKCDNHSCTYLHICRDYMTNSCSKGVTCQLNHHFHNQRDRALLSKINFDQFTDLQLQMLVLSSTPEICVKYNTDGKCIRGDSCTKIHICHGYLRKCCSGDKCGLLHETAMDTDQTKAVLKRLMLSNVDKHEAMNMILDSELSFVDNEPSLSENVTTECHVHQDKPDASSICPQFLFGRCYKGSACTELHCSLPYHWQYKVSLFDEWNCFTGGDNLALEKLYCDVNVKTLVNFKPAQPLDFSRLESQGRFPCDLEHEITIDLDNMTITFQRPRGGEGLLAGLLRRLSTVSYVTWPYESMFTNWKWYWKDNGNVWNPYDKGYSESDLQKQIEQAYQDMLVQRKTEAIYQFQTSENVYDLFFYSTREMYQVNVETGTKRQVKRRPEKPNSDDDLNEWARGDSTAKKKIEERPLKTNILSYIPRHWSSMRVNLPYTRVALDAASTEFQEVEKLFLRSMNGWAVIENIDRVQNPLIWEEYCRNKEKMMQKAHFLIQQQVNEKKLFHGTSPENVEAICEENFDPQIHKNNRMLMLGQGTYFALDALTSHPYAKKDSNLFQYMFLAKVLVGSYTQAYGPSYQRPSPEDIANANTRLYNSRVDNISNPTIFVVFDGNHFYPEYVIQYSSGKSPFGRPVLLKKRSAQYLTPSSTQSGFSALALSSAELTVTTVTCRDNLGTASLTSDSATQSSGSASTVSRAELTGTTPNKCLDNPGPASLNARNVVESSYSVSTLFSSEPVGVETQLNAQIISMRKGTVAESGHLASVVSGSELTSVNPTRRTISRGSTFTPSRTAAESNTPQDKPNASICPQFLIGRCDKGSACTELHCSLPFHWQYKVSLFDEWKCFTDEDNLAVEKMYCDVNVGTLVNFKPAQPLDLSRLQSQGRFPGDLEYEITIDLDNMTITFQKPSGGEGLLAGLLRRLSIASYVTCPYATMFTNWKWYWKDHGNVWHLYGKDYLKRDLQEQIEQAYQDMLRQGKTKAMYQFQTSENVYNLFFYSTREMYQVNVKTGTKRQVKRRPEKPSSDDDLNEWARGDCTSKKNIEESPVKTIILSHVPSHWSSMPLNVPYTRVALDAASAEFQDVEQLFKRSMNGRAVIENIDRVQNPLIWEVYSRSKEKMMKKAQLLNQQQVYEKKLFHGTSPENVEAICEKNFDPGLHSKNKRLNLGQGTYFAVNAVCSHSYAKRASDLFQYMFLAKVLVGCYTKGHPSYRRPPAKDFPSVDTHVYDSCVDDVANPTIFAVFDANHFYPEYIIKYSSLCQPSSEPIPPLLSVSFSSEVSSVHQIRTLNNLDAACFPSGFFARLGYSALPVWNSEYNGVRTTANSNNLDSECSKTRFASLARYAAMSKGNFPYCGQFQPEPTMSHAELTGTSATSSSNNLGTASPPSGCITQSSYSASTMSNAELTGTSATSSSNNLGTASPPSGCITQSSYSASTMSNAQLTGTSVTSSLDNLGTASPLSAFASYSALTVSSSELTDTTSTSSSDNLDTASLSSDSITKSSYSAPTVSNAKLTGPSAASSSDNLGTASTPSASTTESSHSASTVSSAERTDTTLTRSSDNLVAASSSSSSEHL